MFPALPRSFTPVSVSVVLLLGGCAVSETPEWLAPDSFARAEHVDQRFDRLEHSFRSWCNFQDGRSRAQLASQNATFELLRTVHADVQRLKLEEQIVTPDCPPSADEALGEKQILGEVEWIGLPSIGTYLETRVDTGATTSSLSAQEITPFERDGERWVRFKLAVTDKDAIAEGFRDREVEAKRVRTARIRQATGTEERPVVELLVQLGTIEQSVEFTLTDRSEMTFPVLLGRSFLRDIAVVDVSRQYTFERPEYPDGVRNSANAEQHGTAGN